MEKMYFLFHGQLLKELTDVETNLKAKGSTLATTYTTSLALCIVAILRKYHAYLLESHDMTCLLTRAPTSTT